MLAPATLPNMDLRPEAQQEMDRAVAVLADFAGHDLEALSLDSDSLKQAPFFANTVSKLSPIIGNFMELRIAELLNENAVTGFRWERQDPGFPDVVLIDNATGEIQGGYEVKAWYVMATEMTGRFRESVNLLRGKNINVVVVAWCMSNVIYGQPHILGTLVVSGEEVAESRDRHYHKPPAYLIEEPQNTTARTANLQQSNVNGYKVQLEDSDPLEWDKAQKTTYTTVDPHSSQSQAEVKALKNKLVYRLDTNFAKLSRIENADIKKFMRLVMGSTHLGKNFAQWRLIMKDLESSNRKKQEEAKRVVGALYPELDKEVATEVSVESDEVH